LYEDADLAVVNKPSGVLTEGGSDFETSLESWAMQQFNERARCCHRLDRPTSGLILIRKNRRFNAELAAIFAERKVKKSYWALTEGLWPAGIHALTTAIDSSSQGGLYAISETGKAAKTTFRIRGLDRENDVSWLELLLKTGRTHQARVHCASVSCPILGDTAYGAKPRNDVFGLHARELKFTHPGTGELLSVVAEPPESWNQLIADMGRSK